MKQPATKKLPLKKLATNNPNCTLEWATERAETEWCVQRSLVGSSTHVHPAHALSFMCATIGRHITAHHIGSHPLFRDRSLQPSCTRAGGKDAEGRGHVRNDTRLPVLATPRARQAPRKMRPHPRGGKARFPSSWELRTRSCAWVVEYGGDGETVPCDMKEFPTTWDGSVCFGFSQRGLMLISLNHMRIHTPIMDENHCQF